MSIQTFTIQPTAIAIDSGPLLTFVRVFDRQHRVNEKSVGRQFSNKRIQMLSYEVMNRNIEKKYLT